MAPTVEPAEKSFSPKPYVAMGYVTLVLTFGVFGAWAATAPLASGVVAHGTVAVFSNRKVIQHLEGGIVDEIDVHEGDIVEAGDVLVRLEKKQSEGNLSVLSARLALLRATEARLQAESVDASDVVFPQDILAAEDGEEAIAVKLQRTLFHDRKATKDGQVGILRARIDQLNEEVSGLASQRTSYSDQRDSMAEQIERMQEGQSAGYVSTNQVAQLMRARMDLEGNLGRVMADSAKSSQVITETKLQILQIKQEFVERAGTELRDVRDQVSEIAERVKQARDVVDRSVIRAPVRGMVQDIKVHTRSGVVRPAEPIMEIIPLDDDLIVNAHVRPLDIDSVAVGGPAEVRFPAFASRATPVVFGTVEVLSQDVIQPDNLQIEPYYIARVSVSDKDVPELMRGRLVPGMPAEVIIASGERTLFEYIMKPLTDAFSKGLLEK